MPPQAHVEELKHIRLLYNIMSLLVNIEHEDVAAVPIRMRSDRVDFYHVKNTPCDPYVAKFLQRI